MVNLESLTTYVQEQRVPLIHEAALKSKTAGLLSWQPDVKTKAKINLLNTEVIFQDGTTCGWNDMDQQSLTQREIETGVIKINQAYCTRAMINYWMQYKVRANVNPGALPFEEDFVNGILRDIDAKVEKAIWQGDRDNQDDNLNKFNGFVKILNDEGRGVSVGQDSPYDQIMGTYNQMPQAAFDRGDAVIFVGEDMYRAYIQELVAKNLYHFDPQNGADGEYIIPGSTTRVIAVAGLNGIGVAVGGSLRNMFLGFDEEGSEHDFKLWYSDDNDEYRLKVVFNMGVQVAYPDEVILTYHED